MAKKCRYEIMRMGNYIGFYNPCTKKRMCNIYPNKEIKVKRPAKAFEGGYTYMWSSDLHEEMRGKRTVSPEQYKKLKKKYPRHDCGVQARIREEHRRGLHRY